VEGGSAGKRGCISIKNSRETEGGVKPQKRKYFPPEKGNRVRKKKRKLGPVKKDYLAEGWGEEGDHFSCRDIFIFAETREKRGNEPMAMRRISSRDSCCRKSGGEVYAGKGEKNIVGRRLLPAGRGNLHSVSRGRGGKNSFLQSFRGPGKESFEAAVLGGKKKRGEEKLALTRPEKFKRKLCNTRTGGVLAETKGGRHFSYAYIRFC